MALAIYIVVCAISKPVP